VTIHELIADVHTRVVRILEALEDGDCGLAAALARDIDVDIACWRARHEIRRAA
jgi:hypothetical protein